MSLQAADFAECRSFREVVCRLFEAWARQEKKRRWGDKTPHYVTEMPVLLELFPKAKAIHIFRDGRDVALSRLPVRMEPRNLYTAARRWKTWVSAGRRFGASLPRESYLEIRYETLLEQPSETMQAVCAFSDVAAASPVLVDDAQAPARILSRAVSSLPANLAGAPARWRRVASGRLGVGDGIRTRGHRNHNPALYQLSYTHRGAT